MMYRSWAYILMATATLAGVVALLWPSPAVRTIEEIAMPVRPAVRAEAPAKVAKPGPKAGGGKGSQKKNEAPAPPAVIDRMPQQNTSTRRSGTAAPQNGMQPNMFGRPSSEGVALGRKPLPSAPGAAVSARPIQPPRPPPPGDGAPPPNGEEQ